MLVSQKLAIAAHLHVMLRRKTGRVTDTEWMAENQEYALEIVRFARVKAAEDGHPELLEWADKLERAALEPSPVKRPLAQTAVQLLKERNIREVLSGALPPAPAPAAAPAPNTGFSHSTYNDAGTASGFSESTLGEGKPKPQDPAAPSYVGRLR
ncbi:hypothetical protein [Caenimonas koreensis]|uniref:hypothetical protein n=1 Tax=Caenimonas koreensis TaxID=367474 RepID=UPI001E4BFBD7|nr:hypothetical protein [Caenimonas koreensis]